MTLFSLCADKGLFEHCSNYDRLHYNYVERLLCLPSVLYPKVMAHHSLICFENMPNLKLFFLHYAYPL